VITVIAIAQFLGGAAPVPATVRTLDWPVLAGVSLLVAVLLARGRLTRAHGLFLLAIEAGYVAAHVRTG